MAGGKTKRDKRKDKAEELKEQLARALADYDNLRKRIEREKEDLGKLANIKLVIRLLPVFDMLEGAQRHLSDSGLAITIEEFMKVLKEEGIEKIESAPGDKFDEEVHEVVEVVDKDSKAKMGEGKKTRLCQLYHFISDGCGGDAEIIFFFQCLAANGLCCLYIFIN